MKKLLAMLLAAAMVLGLVVIVLANTRGCVGVEYCGDGNYHLGDGSWCEYNSHQDVYIYHDQYDEVRAIGYHRSWLGELVIEFDWFEITIGDVASYSNSPTALDLIVERWF